MSVKFNISQVNYFVTYNCDKSCKYCDIKELPKVFAHNKELNLTEIKKLANELIDFNIDEITLTGGEPFIKKEIFDIIKCFIDVGIVPLIVTKHIFSESEIKRLKNLGLKKITFSLDTTNKKSLEEITGNKDYAENIFNTIKKFVEEGFEVSIISVIHKKSFKDFKKTVDLLNSIGVTIIRPQFLGYFGGISEDNYELVDYSDLYLSDNDMEKFKIDIKELSKVEKFKGLIDYAYIKSEINGVKISLVDALCPLAYGKISIDPFGRILNCIKVMNFFIGDLRKNSLKEILESKMVQDFILPKRENYKGTKCFDCKDFKYCKYLRRCYPDLMRNYGSFFVPIEEYCEMMPELREKIKEKYGLD